MSRPINIIAAAAAIAAGKTDYETKRGRLMAFRRRERRPMATAVGVKTGRYFDRLSNGTLVRAGTRR